MNTWIVLLAIGLGTYGFRVSMFVLLAGRVLPGWLDRPMSVVAPAAIAALVGVMAATQSGRIDPLPLPELLALAIGFVAVRRTGNVMHAFTIGLPALWIASALL